MCNRELEDFSKSLRNLEGSTTYQPPFGVVTQAGLVALFRICMEQACGAARRALGEQGFPETALTYMTASQNFPAIYINRLSQKDLAAHPFLNYTQARDIVSLRRISGVIKTIADISALPSFDAKTIERIKPLLRFEK